MQSNLQLTAVRPTQEFTKTSIAAEETENETYIMMVLGDFQFSWQEGTLSTTSGFLDGPFNPPRKQKSANRTLSRFKIQVDFNITKQHRMSKWTEEVENGFIFSVYKSDGGPVSTELLVFDLIPNTPGSVFSR